MVYSLYWFPIPPPSRSIKARCSEAAFNHNPLVGGPGSPKKTQSTGSAATYISGNLFRQKHNGYLYRTTLGERFSSARRTANEGRAKVEPERYKNAPDLESAFGILATLFF